MATATISGNFSSAKPTILSVCEDALLPSKVTSLNTRSNLWKLASVITRVAYIAIAAVALISLVTSLFYFHDFTLARSLSALITATAALPIKYITKSMDYYSAAAGELADRHSGIQRTAMLVRGDYQEHGMEEIRRLDETLPEGINEQSLPIIVHYLYFKTMSEAFSSPQLPVERIVDAVITDTNPLKILDEHRKVTIVFQQSALEAKVNAAFYHAALSRPDFRGTLNDVVSSTPLPFSRHPIRYRLEDESLKEANGSDLLLTLKDKSVLTYDAVKAMTINDLSQRILPQMQ